MKMWASTNNQLNMFVQLENQPRNIRIHYSWPILVTHMDWPTYTFVTVQPGQYAILLAGLFVL